MDSRTLFLINLTKTDFDNLHHAKVMYSGSAGDPHFDSDPTPWGSNAPYIASFVGQFFKAIRALKWKCFSVKVIEDQWFVKRIR